jgi:hypothetical protein
MATALMAAAVTAGPLEPLRPLETAEGWVLVDRKGEVAVRPKVRVDGMEAAGVLDPVTDELIPARIGERWGYVDRSGTLVVPAGYDQVEPFSEGRAAVRRGRHWGFIDEMGVEIVPPHYLSAGPYREGRAAVTMRSALWPMVGYLDRSGAVAIPATFQSDCPFSEGRARVERRRRKALLFLDSQWGYIDSAGALVVTPRFRFARDFAEGVAAAQFERDGRALWGYIGRDGRWAIEPQFEAAEDFSEGLAAVRRSGAPWSYVDHAGREVLSLAQGRPQSYGFSERRAAVKVGDRTGYIDPTGAFAIPPRFRSGSRFGGGLAAVVLANGRAAYVDTTGRVVPDSTAIR